MQAVIRQYIGPGAVELFKILETRAADIETLMRSVKGFVSYTLARTGAGGFTVTVCQDRSGIDESIQKARDYISKNVSPTGAAPPAVTIGDAVMHLK